MGKNNVLVTGANGFLGQAILFRLVSSGLSVCATDLGPNGNFPDVIYRKADITKPEEIRPVFENATTVIHVAGLAHIFSLDVNSAEKFKQINEIGTANVAEAAAVMGVKHLILISSVSVYGPHTYGMCDENAACVPIGPYALSKYNSELRAIDIARKSGVALTILRLATLYGEGDPGNLAHLIKLISRGLFIWIGKGENFKSLLHRDDAAIACLAVTDALASGINIYNVSAPPSEMRDIVEIIADALGKTVPSWYIPASLALNSAKILKMLSFNRGKFSTTFSFLQKWLADDYYSVANFCKDYNFKTSINLEDGICREVDWLKKKYDWK
jgi:nucleoside-diphosphate-sugar epimerase